MPKIAGGGGGIAERPLAAGRATRRASGGCPGSSAAGTRRSTRRATGRRRSRSRRSRRATRNSIESWNVFTLVGVGDVRRRAPSTSRRCPRTARSTANARTFTCAMLMPTVSAADSWSRTAIRARPKRLRTSSTDDDHDDDGRAERDVVGPLVVAADRRHRRRDPRRRRELGAVERHEVRPARRAQVLRHVTVDELRETAPRARA